MAEVRFGPDDDLPAILALPDRRHVQAWYHLFVGDNPAPVAGHEASLMEVTRLLTNSRAIVHDESKTVTRISLKRLDGKREVITFTESGS